MRMNAYSRGFPPRQIALTAAAGSAALLIAALGFQAMGYAPCELCILQRWPHLVAALIGVAIWRLGWNRALAALGLLAALTATGLAIYHSGVELKLWQGPQACSGGVSGIANMSTQDLLTAIEAAPMVRCSDVAWSFLGISMAGWNAICSAVLSALWLTSLRGRQPVRGTA